MSKCDLFTEMRTNGQKNEWENEQITQNDD